MQSPLPPHKCPQVCSHEPSTYDNVNQVISQISYFVVIVALVVWVFVDREVQSKSTILLWCIIIASFLRVFKAVLFMGKKIADCRRAKPPSHQD